MSSFPQDTPGGSGLGSFQDTASSLGSLKQKARGKNLRAARIALGLAAFIMFAQTALEYFTAEKQLDDAFAKEIQKAGPGVIVNQEKLKEAKAGALRIVNLFCLGLAGIAVIFVVLTVLVYRFPLFCTVGGLVLYIGLNLIIAYLIVKGNDGVDMVAALSKGFIWKIIIIVGLIKGIQAAIAYQKERAAVDEVLPGV